MPDSDLVTDTDDRHFGLCTICSAALKNLAGDTRPRFKHTETERICYLCRRTLPTDRFTRRSSGTYFSACKDCNKYVFSARRRAKLRKANHGKTVNHEAI